jgi:tetratricopeptide (TPR) repeat protein
MRLFSAIGLESGKAHSLVGLALLEMRCGQPEVTVPYGFEAYHLFQQSAILASRQRSAFTALALRCLGGCLRDCGRFEEAGSYLDKAIEMYQVLGHCDGVALSLAAKARLVDLSATPREASAGNECVGNRVRYAGTVLAGNRSER